MFVLETSPKHVARAEESSMLARCKEPRASVLYLWNRPLEACLKNGNSASMASHQAFNGPWERLGGSWRRGAHHLNMGRIREGRYVDCRSWGWKQGTTHALPG